MKTGYADARQAVKSAYTMVSAIGHLPPVEQASGVFAFFAALCERLNIRPDVAWERGQRYLADGDIAREVSALRQYIQEEIKQ